ncbi:MAG: hypothetical protein CL599_07755 [Alteromonas sp.]|nr:hypothetical protein [Alteromonas sp.]
MRKSVKFRTLVRRPNINMDTQQVDLNRWGHIHNLIITMTGWGFLIVKMTDDYRKSWYIQYPHKWLVSQWRKRQLNRSVHNG